MLGIGQTVVSPTPAFRVRAQAPLPVFLGGLGQDGGNGMGEKILLEPTPAYIGVQIGASLFTLLLMGGVFYVASCQARKRCG